jgi:hypothetical protein
VRIVLLATRDAACAGLSEFFEATASLAGYFPKPTTVHPFRTFDPAQRLMQLPGFPDGAYDAYGAFGEIQ